MSALLVASCLLGSLLQGIASVSDEEAVALALVDAGAAPRRALRLAHRPGWGQRARLSVTWQVDTVLGVGPGAELRTEYGPEVVVPLRLELPVHGRGVPQRGVVPLRLELPVHGGGGYRRGVEGAHGEEPAAGGGGAHAGVKVPRVPDAGGFRAQAAVTAPAVSNAVELRVWRGVGGRRRLMPGEARYRLGVGRPEVRAVDEDGVESTWRLAEELGAMSGREGEVVLSATGVVVDGGMALREGASPALTALVAKALSSEWLGTPRFPEEPVGPGARWSMAWARGPDALSIITYELAELRGSRGRVRFQLHTRQRGRRSEPEAEGELRFDLRRPLPERMAVLYTSRSQLELGSARRRLEVVRRTHVTLEAGAPEPLPLEVGRTVPE
ncbi:hypothetical protein [Pyxidicoccus xibeiensis]|uniref:hypothetical protein n=1 Tax=Pyxidicoccus xibeiensis TaxID=2906759 RepID=UPI0020A78C47|nr:hypothetical protein [Pyxidicoccus xibeiensis]MCP3142727.1 hypothetical protein [Pyxidicoccus xibeiensis]